MNFRHEREEVLNTAREMFAQGLVVGTWGNVSVRLPDAEGIVITPSGMDYARLTPEDMVIVDMAGNKLWGEWKPSVEVPMHLAIYQGRPDVGAIVHVHSVAASSFAVAGISIPAVLEETVHLIGGPVQVAAYAPYGTHRLAQQAVAALGQNNAVLLANHGLVGVGATAASALRACQVAEKTARVVIYARILESGLKGRSLVNE